MEQVLEQIMINNSLFMFLDFMYNFFFSSIEKNTKHPLFPSNFAIILWIIQF